MRAAQRSASHGASWISSQQYLAALVLTQARPMDKARAITTTATRARRTRFSGASSGAVRTSRRCPNSSVARVASEASSTLMLAGIVTMGLRTP